VTKKTFNNSGQALLIVLLSLSVVLIVALYIVSRSITDISISNKEEDSLRAFSAAEAGIERALVIGEGLSSSVGDASFSTSVSNFAQGSSSVVYPLSLASGEVSTIWFAGHNDDGTLGCNDEACFTGDTVKICWGSKSYASDSDTTPAIEASFVYLSTPGNYSSARIARAVYDPNASRRLSNHFDASDGTGCDINGEKFGFYKTLDLSDIGIANSTVANALQYVQLRILYNTDENHKVGMDVGYPGNSVLPGQGIKVDSLGSYAQSNRKIEVYQLHPDIPAVFQNAIFSLNSIVK